MRPVDMARPDMQVLRRSSDIHLVAIDAAEVRYAEHVASGVDLGILRQTCVSEGVDAAWPLIEEWCRDRIADEMAVARQDWIQGKIHRPKCETGGYLNDWAWAAEIVKGRKL